MKLHEKKILQNRRCVIKTESRGQSFYIAQLLNYTGILLLEVRSFIVDNSSKFWTSYSEIICCS